MIKVGSKVRSQWFCQKWKVTALFNRPGIGQLADLQYDGPSGPVMRSNVPVTELTEILTFEVREGTKSGALLGVIELNSSCSYSIIQTPRGLLAYKYGDVYVVENGYFVSQSDVVSGNP